MNLETNAEVQEMQYCIMAQKQRLCRSVKVVDVVVRLLLVSSYLTDVVVDCGSLNNGISNHLKYAVFPRY